MSKSLRVIGPSRHLEAGDVGEGLGELTFALAKLLEELTLFESTEHVGLATIQVGKPVRVVVPRTKPSNTSGLCSGTPAQLRLIWLNKLRSIGFHFEQPVG